MKAMLLLVAKLHPLRAQPRAETSRLQWMSAIFASKYDACAGVPSLLKWNICSLSFLTGVFHGDISAHASEWVVVNLCVCLSVCLSM